MFLNRCYENENNGMKYDENMQCCMPTQVMECPQERVCHRQICYDVTHVIPINTRIINHHIYRHSYQPMYTCTTEDEVCNVYDNHCGM